MHKRPEDGWWSVLQPLRSRQAWQLTVFPPSRLCLDKFSSASQVAINHPLCLNITSILRAGEGLEGRRFFVDGCLTCLRSFNAACRLHNAHYTWLLAAHFLFYSFIIIQDNHRTTHDISFDFCRRKQRRLTPEGRTTNRDWPNSAFDPLRNCCRLGSCFH